MSGLAPAADDRADREKSVGRPPTIAAEVDSKRGSKPSRHGLLTVVGTLALAAAFAACSSGLSSAQWLWCKQHLAAVDEAAETLGIAKAQTSYQEPSWWADYVTSTQNSNNALIVGNPAFIAACDDAATNHDVGESRQSWCTTDGLAEVWDSSIALGYMTPTEAETFAYKALPLGKRLDNPDFVSACRAANGS